MQFESQPEDVLTMELTLQRAGNGKRLANYIIDVVAFYLLIVLIYITLAIISPGIYEFIVNMDTGFGLIDRVITLVLYAVFMSLLEIAFKGKSFGKYLTKTRAVNMDGTRIGARTAFARGFSRAVPFCVFSAFGNPCDPWQDRWTNTMVVNE